ncbi:MAG: GIY-YIG nuclease family protein [Bacteroidota bacterium]
MKKYYVYIMSNASRTLYIGMTNNLRTRISQHQEKLIPGFTERYNVTKLIYFEEYDDVRYTITREKEIKKWRREKKIKLIESMNPNWEEIIL